MTLAPSSTTTLIRGARVLHAPRPVDVVFRDGEVAAPGAPIPPDAEVLDAGGRWLLPGLIDIQINDIEWLARGFQDAARHVERIAEVASHQLRRGVTGFVLATLAAPIEEVLAYLVGMCHALDRGPGVETEAFLGGLVEGTFMNPEYHGAHNPDWVLAPDVALLERLLDTRAMRLLNVAPETSADALEVIAEATKRGVVVGCGHAKPNAVRVREAIAAGLRYVIHLGNGPTGSSLKRFDDGGLLEETLRNDRLIATIIIDDWHVHPQLVRDWIERKGIDRVVGVSDAGFALGPPARAFDVFGIRGGVEEKGRYLFVEPKPGTRPRNEWSSDPQPLFGAAIDQLRVFENTINLLAREMEGVYYRRHPATPLAAAVAAASRICATNPAALIGETRRGTLEAGMRADAILADIDEGDGGRIRVRLERAFLAGRAISAAER